MFITPDELKQQKKSRNALRLESIEKSTEADIVAHFLHNKPKNIEKVRFERHQPDSRRQPPVYTVKGSVNENVVEIGEEVCSINEGFDYALAIVDKETGCVTYKPARYYLFESKYTTDPENLKKTKKKDTVDFNADFSLTVGQWAEKRKLLTENFGSAKKIKMHEAAMRRAIEQETLEEMKKTAFVNTDVKKDVEDIKVDDISMLNKTHSSILPPHVDSKIPREIYPLSLFLSDEDIEAASEEALELMNKKRKEKVDAGIPEAVMLIMNNEKTKERAAAFLLLSTMVEIIMKLGKSRSMLRKDIHELMMPMAFRQKVQTDYFGSAQSDRGSNGHLAERIRLATTDFDRFVAYTIALALTLAPEHKIPLSPFQTAMCVPPSKLEKLVNGLGADIIKLDVVAAQQMHSLRGAVLLKPPTGEIKKGRARRSGR